MFFPLKCYLQWLIIPIVFCNGKSVPEIDYHLAIANSVRYHYGWKVRLPNQVNNVLGYHIYFVALDVQPKLMKPWKWQQWGRLLLWLRARSWTGKYRLWSNQTYLWRDLYHTSHSTKINYIVAPAVAKAAMDSGWH
jgi:hypothetical protein